MSATFQDWRDLAAGEMDAEYAAECARWSGALHWDYRPSFEIVERARQAGRLPGLVVRNGAGEIAGWSFFVVHDGILQIGALQATSAGVLRELLDRVLAAPEAAFARAITCFLFPVSASLRSALERQRFTVHTHLHLERDLAASGTTPAWNNGFRLRALDHVDAADVVRLAARAYAGRPEARCFAPDGRLEQWAQYLGQLLTTPACGHFLPAVSLAVDEREGGRLVAALVSTAVGPETAHIAQIIVDPEARRSGLARRLIETMGLAVAAEGYRRQTLIVAESNEPARALYASLGFRQTASFLFGSRPVPNRRSSGQ